MDPEKKDSFDVIPKKEFTCWDELPMANWEPTFYK